MPLVTPGAYVCLIGVLLCKLCDCKEYDAFHPGELWLDTDGNRIRAHSAGLMTLGKTTYWYGADGYNAGDGLNKIINVYSSTDLYNWKNHGPAFVMNCSEIPGAGDKCYADRPKVLHDVTTNQFVMWMKSTPWAAIATASSPIGPFTFHARWYPNGEHMGDPTAFHDPVSGRSFWIYSLKPDQEKRVVRVSEMDNNLLNLSSIVSTILQPREAPQRFTNLSRSATICGLHTPLDGNPIQQRSFLRALSPFLTVGRAKEILHLTKLVSVVSPHTSCPM